MKKSLITLAGLACLSGSLLAPVVASAYTPVNPQDLPPLVLDPLDNQVMTTTPLPPQSYTGLVNYANRPYATPIQPLPLNQIKPGPPKADPTDTSNGYQPLAPIVVAPEDSQVMTTTPLPPKESQPMENGYQPLPPIVVAPEDNQVMTTTPLPPQESAARPSAPVAEEASDDYTAESETAASDDYSYDYSYDYNNGYSYDYHYDYSYDYGYNYNYNYNYNYGYYYGY